MSGDLNPETSPPPTDSTADHQVAQTQRIALSLIDPGIAHEQRLELSEEHVERLMRTIVLYGILVPLRVAPAHDRYTIIAGAHRCEAAKRLGIREVPCIIDHEPTSQHAARAAIDNLDRRDLSPLEEAEAVRKMHVDAGLEPAEIAAQIGRTKAWVHDRLELLTWPPEILEAVHHRSISKAAAAPLAQIERDDLRATLLYQAINLGSSARTTSQWLATSRARRDAGVQPTANAVLNAPEAPRVIPTADCTICGERADLADLSTPTLHFACLESLIAFVAQKAAPPTAPDPAIQPV